MSTTRQCKKYNNKYKEYIKLIIRKEGNQNSGVEYGDIRPGLISRRVKKKKRKKEKKRKRNGERGKMWEERVQKGKGENVGGGGGGGRGRGLK